MAKAIVDNIEKDNDAIEKVEFSQMGKGDPAKSGFFLNIHLKNSFIQQQIKQIQMMNTITLQQLEDVNKQNSGVKCSQGQASKKGIQTQEGTICPGLFHVGIQCKNPDCISRKGAGQKKVHDPMEESKEPTQQDVERPPRVLVDFSSPNIAKDMHVGHLRSTIQGDSICRIFEFLGYEVHRINHVGDWGTQFGMLIAEMDDSFPNFLNEKPEIKDLQVFYQKAKKRFDAEEDFKERARQNVVKLQSGDDHCVKAWKMLCELSRNQFQIIYDRLDIRLEEVGESFYNPMLRGLVDDLLERKIAVENEGAKCVFVPKIKVPLIVQKSDGGFNYDTTDMAAIKYRAQEVGCDRIIYVTDIGQEFHFKLVFAGGALAGYYDPNICKPEHMPFGTVNGEDGKKMKSRSGDTIKLQELLDEGKERALKMFEERLATSADKVKVDPAKKEETAEKMSISAIKYFDLRQNRVQNYNFSFDKMLDPTGNTGIYMLYMYVRILSIMEKSDHGTGDILAKHCAEGMFTISNPSERQLAMAALRLPEQLELSVQDLQINKVCELVAEIADNIGGFYRDSKVVGSDEEISRVLLLEATRKVMAKSFDLLGMMPVDKM